MKTRVILCRPPGIGVLEALLRATPDVEPVARVADADELVWALDHMNVDAVVVSEEVSGWNRAVERLLATHAHLRILVLADHGKRGTVFGPSTRSRSIEGISVNQVLACLGSSWPWEGI